MKKLVLLSILILLSANIVLAFGSPISTTPSKLSYNLGETFQAEVVFSFEPAETITSSNFLLKGPSGNTIPVIMQREKISTKHYFIYFDIPTNLEKGKYSFVVDKFNYIEDGELKQTSYSSQFDLNTLNKGYAKLLSAQKADGSIDSDVVITSLAAIAFKNAGYTEQADNAIDWIVLNQDPKGCYPLGNCKVKDTSFALLALDEFSKDVIKPRNWLTDASNSFKLGSWALKISSSQSESGICYVNNNPITITSGKGSYTLTQQQTFPIKVNCSSLSGVITTSFTHSYLGTAYSDLFTYQGKELTLPLETSGCYGMEYKEACDYISTGYASYALKQIGENPDTNVLADPSDSSTLEQALNYLNTKNSYSLSWMQNNRQQKAWSTTASYQNNQNDIYTTAIVALALKDQPTYYSDAKSWVSSQNYLSNLEAAISLYALFLDEKIPISFSVAPAVILASPTQKKFTINLENKGIASISITLEPNALLTYSKSAFDLITKFSFDITVDTSKATSTMLNIQYSNATYSIPVMVQSQYGGAEESSLLLPIPKDAIKILKLDLSSDEWVDVGSSINANVSSTKRIEQTFKIQNSYSVPLHNLSLDLTGTLSQLLTLDIFSFEELNPEETMDIALIGKEDVEPGSYHGSLVISSQEGITTELPITLKVTTTSTATNLVPSATPTETTKSSNGTFLPRDTISTGASAKQSGGFSWKWIVTIIVIALIGGIFFWFKFGGKKTTKQPFDAFVRSVEKRKL